MTITMTLALMAAVLLVSGLGQRVLERMYLTRRAALILLSLLFAGSMLPMLTVGPARLNPGGLLLPSLVVAYLLMGEDSHRAAAWVMLCAAGIGVVLYALRLLTPAVFDESPAVAVAAFSLLSGLAAGMVLRRPRSAAACAMSSVMIYDLADCITARLRGRDALLLLGHTELCDMAAISALSGVTCAILLQTALEALRIGRPGHAHE